MLDTIIVKRSIFGDEDDRRIVLEVVDYVNFMRFEALYLNDELPRNAIRSYYVDYYMSQVADVGHGQFGLIAPPSAYDMKAAKEGLEAIGLEPFLSIFKEFETFLAEHSTQSEDVNNGSSRFLVEV